MMNCLRSRPLRGSPQARRLLLEARAVVADPPRVPLRRCEQNSFDECPLRHLHCSPRLKATEGVRGTTHRERSHTVSKGRSAIARVQRRPEINYFLTARRRRDAKPTKPRTEVSETRFVCIRVSTCVCRGDLVAPKSNRTASPLVLRNLRTKVVTRAPAASRHQNKTESEQTRAY